MRAMQKIEREETEKEKTLKEMKVDSRRTELQKYWKTPWKGDALTCSKAR